MKLSYPEALPKLFLIALCAVILGSGIACGSGTKDADLHGRDNPKQSASFGAALPTTSLFLEEGFKAEQAGHSAEAVTAYEKIVAAEPDLLEGYLRLGALYFKLGLSSKAEELYLQTIQRGIADGQVYFLLGYMEENRKKFPEALGYYLKAEEKLLKNPELFYNIGNVYAQQGDMDKAIVYYSRAVSMKPDHLDAFVNLSVVSFRKGNYADAQFYLAKAEGLGYKAPLEYLQAIKEKLKN